MSRAGAMMHWALDGKGRARRSAARKAYRRGRMRGAGDFARYPAHWHGLFTALAAASRQPGQRRPSNELWRELAPFLLIEDEEDGIEALAEYLVFRERPEAADIERLGILLNAAVRPLDERHAELVGLLRSAFTSHTFGWLALFSYHNLRLLRRMVAAS